MYCEHETLLCDTTLCLDCEHYPEAENNERYEEVVRRVEDVMRQDNACDFIVPSDLRMLVEYIKILKEK